MKKIYLLLIALMVVTNISVAQTNFSPAVEALWQKAKKHHKNRQFEQAAASLERALRIDPNNPYLWHGLANVHMAQGDWKRATHLATKSLTLAGSDRDELRKKNRRLITKACQKMGSSCTLNQPKVTTPSENVSEISNPEYLSNLAELRLTQKKWRKAISFAGKSLTLIEENESYNLQIKNWVVITRACEAMDDWVCSRRARNRAQALVQKNYRN